MDFVAHPQPMEVKFVEIICPVCNSDRVEPLDCPMNDMWECYRCGQEFMVNYSEEVNGG